MSRATSKVTDEGTDVDGVEMAVAVASPLPDQYEAPLAQAKKEIDEELAQEGSLEELDFAGNYMGSAGAKYLATKLSNCDKCVELDLRVNNIDDEGVKTLIKSIPKSVKVLLLRNNAISDEGAKAIADFLESNTTITICDLSDNDIGDEGAKALARMLGKNTTLKDLDLFHNAIGDDGGKALAEALKKCKLDDFDISANDIQDTELEYEMEADFKDHLEGPSETKSSD